MSTEQHFIFKIVQQIPIDINIPFKKTQEFPVHEHYLIEVKELVVIYKFKPTRSLNIDAYKDYLTKFLKRKYKAYSITSGILQQQLQSNVANNN